MSSRCPPQVQKEDLEGVRFSARSYRCRQKGAAAIAPGYRSAGSSHVLEQ